VQGSGVVRDGGAHNVKRARVELGRTAALRIHDADLIQRYRSGAPTRAGVQHTDRMDRSPQRRLGILRADAWTLKRRR